MCHGSRVTGLCYCLTDSFFFSINFPFTYPFVLFGGQVRRGDFSVELDEPRDN